MNIYDPPFLYEDLPAWVSYLDELRKSENTEAEIKRVEAVIEQKKREIQRSLMS